MPSYPDANYIPLLSLLYTLGLCKVVPMIEEYEMYRMQMEYMEMEYERKQDQMRRDYGHDKI